MLYAWGFQQVGVVAGDMYFEDPDPNPGQEGAERGVRVEVRLLERPPLTGSIYAAQPILIDRPVWRADLFESVTGPVGSKDRTHHHPTMRGFEPGKRSFDPALTADPVGWLTARLSALPELVAEAELDPDTVGTDDAAQLAAAAPEIAATVERLLERVRNGELAKEPDAVVGAVGARSGWL
jgi:hypothetical protein